MAVTEGSVIKTENPEKRGFPENKSKRSGTGAMTLNSRWKILPWFEITLNEEWANKMQNISEMLNSKIDPSSQGQRTKDK